MSLTVEALAKEIRQIDENYGAGDQLATALLAFIERHIAAGQTEDALVLRSLVAAGHVDQSKAAHARDLMRPLATPTPAADAGGVTEEMVERAVLAYEDHAAKQGFFYPGGIDREQIRAALTAALTPEVRHA